MSASEQLLQISDVPHRMRGNPPFFTLWDTHLEIQLETFRTCADEAERAKMLRDLDLLRRKRKMVESVHMVGIRRRFENEERDDTTTVVVASESFLMSSVFTSLGGLYMLQRLVVYGKGRMGTAGVHLPMQALTIFLNQAHFLRFLRLDNVVLSGGEEQVVSLADSLKRHESLTSFDLVRCRPLVSPPPAAAAAESQTIVSLVPIIQALAQIPTLQHVECNETLISASSGDSDDYHSTTTYCNALARLCQSPDLESLWWKDMTDFTDHRMVRLTQQLQANSSTHFVRELVIRSHGLGLEACAAIGNMLQSTKQLLVLKIDLDSYDCAVPIAHSLAHNSSLRHLDLWAWDHDNMDQLTQAFEKILVHNYALKDLTCLGTDWSGSAQITFFLKLNRIGRQLLLEKSSTQLEWLQTIIANNDDVSIVFYFLSLYPSLCQLLSHNSHDQCPLGR